MFELISLSVIMLSIKSRLIDPQRRIIFLVENVLKINII